MPTTPQKRLLGKPTAVSRLANRGNRFRLLHAAAYLLMQTLRKLVAGTDLSPAQVSTLGLWLLKVGARIRESVCRVRMQPPSAYPWFALWQRLRRAAPG